MKEFGPKTACPPWREDRLPAVAGGPRKLRNEEIRIKELRPKILVVSAQS
jgi:hypothetical protein